MLLTLLLCTIYKSIIDWYAKYVSKYRLQDLFYNKCLNIRNKNYGDSCIQSAVTLNNIGGIYY